MDPFEVRMQFLGLLRRLDASQQSIKKIVGYAVKYFPSCGEDLWDCMLEECQKGSLNNRMNILHLLDSLCEASLVTKPPPGASHSSSSSSYTTYVSRDLQKILDGVVPDGRQGLPNLMSTKQILESWRTKRVVDPQKVDDAITALDERRAAAAASATRASSPDSSAGALTRDDIKRRMEEDRERHKRLRERRWVQPVGHALPAVLPPLASFLPLVDEGGGPGSDLGVLDIEFDNEWEATSDWNEDDDEAVAEENELCFVDAGEYGASDEQAMDLS
ncbi:CTD kinase subunit gamma CTK3-domain-containing protein [Lenzites betulinus]|nr:CTD kinase subunit gamma CTK3-domain-containing protein [Lenzites betulinus]